MIVLDKNSPVFQYVSERNRARQYDFLRTAFEVSRQISDFEIGKEFLCDLNYYAVQYLSPQPGRYRHDGYNVTVGRHVPPTFDQVEGLMERFGIVSGGSGSEWRRWRAPHSRYGA